MPPTQFPLKPLDALRLSLFNHPYVHRQMSVKQVQEALQDEGDFLVQVPNCLDRQLFHMSLL